MQKETMCTNKTSVTRKLAKRALINVILKTRTWREHVCNAQACKTCVTDLEARVPWFCTASRTSDVTIVTSITCAPRKRYAIRGEHGGSTCA